MYGNKFFLSGALMFNDQSTVILNNDDNNNNLVIIILYGDTVTVSHLTKCNTNSKVRAISA